MPKQALTPTTNANTPSQPHSSLVNSPSSPATPSTFSFTATPKGKGTGKGKGKTKSSEQIQGKTKYDGAHTRLRAKHEQASKEHMKSGFQKLLNVSRNLTENPEQFDNIDPDQPSTPLIGDFSSHDLIQNSIADPPSFDEQIQQNSPVDIVNIPAVNETQSVENENVVSRWNFSINPLSYFQRSESPASSCVANAKDIRNAGKEIEQIEDSVSSPQRTSTPNDWERGLML